MTFWFLQPRILMQACAVFIPGRARIEHRQNQGHDYRGSTAIISVNPSWFTHRKSWSSAASLEIFSRKPVDFIRPKCIHFQTFKIFRCRGFICRMFWRRAQGNLQLPAGHFGCSVSKIMQINRWTAARSWLECGLEWGSSSMEWTGQKFYCKCTC